MNRKRGYDKCPCGYEGRQDNVFTHKKKCKTLPLIESLQEQQNLLNEENQLIKQENESLKEKIEYLESLLKTSSNVTINNNNPVINNNINNNINNITFYGNEELPKALTEIRQLCRVGNFADCVPRYIEMKHFPEAGKGNIRFDAEGKVLEVFKHDRWVEVSKDTEISKMTATNSEEVIERYGEKPIANFFKDWASNNLKNTSSSEFQNVKQRVEDVILKNS